jgi:hypothetical protein
MRAFWDVAPCNIIGADRRFRNEYCLVMNNNLFITLMMEVVRTSETSVYSETTRRYIPEGYHLRTCRCENLKSHDNGSCSKKTMEKFYVNNFIEICRLKVCNCMRALIV